jgi:hypothetical protein
MAKSKKQRAAERAQNSCRNVLGDDKICDKVFDKAMNGPGPEPKRAKKGE